MYRYYDMKLSGADKIETVNKVMWKSLFAARVKKVLLPGIGLNSMFFEKKILGNC